MQIAYTDGACKGNGKAGAKGGFGVYLQDGVREFEWCGFENSTTNNRMELMGAIVALECSDPARPLTIYTDSSYVQNGVTQWLSSWKRRGWKKADKSAVLNVDLWQRLDSALSKHTKVAWQWVRGHAGNEGNERADGLANKGADGICQLPNTYTKAQSTKAQSDTQRNLQDDKNHVPHNAKLLVNNQITSHHKAATNENDTITPKATMIDNDPHNHSNQDDNLQDWQSMDLHDLGIDDDMHALFKKPTISAQEQALLGDILGEGYTNKYHAPDKLADKNANPNTDPNKNVDANTTQASAFDGDTSYANPNFVMILPDKSHHANRQLILDTETTGLHVHAGDRIIEIGAVEMVGRKLTGQKLHIYLNPQRSMDDEAIAVHGISEAFLADKPTFDMIAPKLFNFLQGAEIIAHNANFDMGFLVHEFAKVGLDFKDQVQVTDSVEIAKNRFPGQKVSLDALVRRLDVPKRDRTFHGALLDAQILADVYLALTGGQFSLDIDEVRANDGAVDHQSIQGAQCIASVRDDDADSAWRATMFG